MQPKCRIRASSRNLMTWGTAVWFRKCVHSDRNEQKCRNKSEHTASVVKNTPQWCVGGTKAWLHTFLTQAVDNTEWLLPHSSHSISKNRAKGTDLSNRRMGESQNLSDNDGSHASVHILIASPALSSSPQTPWKRWEKDIELGEIREPLAAQQTPDVLGQTQRGRRSAPEEWLPARSRGPRLECPGHPGGNSSWQQPMTTEGRWKGTCLHTPAEFRWHLAAGSTATVAWGNWPATHSGHTQSGQSSYCKTYIHSPTTTSMKWPLCLINSKNLALRPHGF